MGARILIGDCRERLKELPDDSVDSIVCDPPYHLVSQDKRDHRRASPSEKQRQKIKASAGFMGQEWDGGDVAFDPDTWAEVLRVLKPGGHMVAFSGTRTYHRMVCAIEDAGFEIRDQLAWVYGSGFPKSLNVSKMLDKADGRQGAVTLNARASAYHPDGTKEPSGDNLPPYEARTEAGKGWEGYGTALKPSWEPICLARKPLIGSVASNVLTHGTGALNIDGCRVDAGGESLAGGVKPGGGQNEGWDRPFMSDPKAIAEWEQRKRDNQAKSAALGRWPANLCHDGSDEVLAGFPDELRARGNLGPSKGGGGMYGHGDCTNEFGAGDSGSAARFFYCAKATTEERGQGNNHPTVKPVALMRWLCKLVTPKGGTVLDPFMGSGSTGLAAFLEQLEFIGCEMSPEYAEIARIRLSGDLFASVKVA